MNKTYLAVMLILTLAARVVGRIIGSRVPQRPTEIVTANEVQIKDTVRHVQARLRANMDGTPILSVGSRHGKESRKEPCRVRSRFLMSERTVTWVAP